jgi:hypothetical protein
MTISAGHPDEWHSRLSRQGPQGSHLPMFTMLILKRNRRSKQVNRAYIKKPMESLGPQYAMSKIKNVLSRQ